MLLLAFHYFWQRGVIQNFREFSQQKFGLAPWSFGGHGHPSFSIPNSIQVFKAIRQAALRNPIFFLGEEEKERVDCSRGDQQ